MTSEVLLADQFYITGTINEKLVQLQLFKHRYTFIYLSISLFIIFLYLSVYLFSSSVLLFSNERFYFRIQISPPEENISDSSDVTIIILKDILGIHATEARYIYLSNHLYIYLSLYLSIYIYPSIYYSIDVTIIILKDFLFIHATQERYIYLSIFLFIDLSIN